MCIERATMLWVSLASQTLSVLQCQSLSENDRCCRTERVWLARLALGYYYARIKLVKVCLFLKPTNKDFTYVQH